MPSCDVVPLNDELSLDTLTLRDLLGSHEEVAKEREEIWVRSSSERFGLERDCGVSTQVADEATGEGTGPHREVRSTMRKETRGTLGSEQ